MYKESKIFGIGLPRTGTTSLHNALKLLGIKSIHFPFKLYDSNDISILKKYNAFIDSPIPLIYKDLDRMFPQSKFILTTRPLEDWLSSMKWLFDHGSAKWKPSLSMYKYRKEFLGCESFDRSILEKKYYSFHDDAIKYFENRERDFLVLDIEKNASFENLCNFLNLPVIKFDYPLSNKRVYVSIHQRLKYRYLIKNIRAVKQHLIKIKSHIFRKKIN